MKNQAYHKILEETQQSPSMRKKLLEKIEKHFNKTAISFLPHLYFR